MTHNPTATPLLVVSRWLGLSLRGLARSADDVRRYTWTCGLCLVAMYALLAAALSGIMPSWPLLLLVPPLYLRSALNVHELMHARSERQVSWLHRLMMALESPVTLGYREHRDIHLRHHRHCASDADPEFFQIRGGHLRALAAAAVSPEWMAIDYLRERRTTPAFAGEAAIRLAVFAFACAVNPLAFLYYWTALRASITVSQYAFHHVLHQRDGRYGTFALELSPPIERTLGLVIGRECVHILTEHPAHHAWQVVKPEQLPVVAAALSAGTAGAGQERSVS